jgi:hypothetical protein
VRDTAEFAKLLRRLVRLVEAEARSPLTDSALSDLERGVRHAILVYEGTKFATEFASRSTLHEIAEPLTHVIGLLEDEANRDAVLVALSPPEWIAMQLGESPWSKSKLSPQEAVAKVARMRRGRFSIDGRGTPGAPIPTEDEQQAASCYRNLFDDLRSISRAVPMPPAKRNRGAPEKKGRTDPFHDLVDRLATAWERATDKPFRQHWYDKKKGVAANSAAQFVQAVVEMVDPARLRSLPKMTERIVTERISLPNK